MKRKVDELIKFNEGFVRKLIKNNEEVSPQIVVSKDKKVKVVGVVGGRETVKSALNHFSKDFDWLVYFGSGYSKKAKSLKGYRYGEMEKEYKKGSKAVMEVVIIQAYTQDDKKMAVYKIEDNDIHKLAESDNFEGYLTIQ